MSRFQCVSLALIVLAIGIVGSSVRANSTILDAATIKAGLHTAAPEDEGFVERVVDLSNQGKLPAKLVDSTFQWARKKPRNKFQYFKRGLILRARRIGIEL
ncbi:MAG: hypothetical protein GXY83_29525 [Rhodopirellula sp.]|nr:hypothetical protein [Rhodopirellula sp.]